MNTPLLPRSQVPAEEQWNLADIFPDDAAWEAALTAADAEIPTVAAYAGRLAESSSVLLDALNLRETLAVKVFRVSVYASLKRAGDVGDQNAAALSSRAGGLGARFFAAVAFFEPELLASNLPEIPEPYHHYFDKLNLRKAHVLSSDVEKVLAAAMEVMVTPSQAAGALTNADMMFGDVNGEKVAQGTIGELTNSTDRETRKRAWESYADGYLGVKNTLAATLSGSMKRTVFLAKTRGYGSALEASLFPNAIPTEVFHNLLSVFVKNLPTWHKYFGILKRGLGVDTLNVYDCPAYGVPAPIGEFESNLPYAKGVELICDGMAPLGEDYVNPMRRGLLDERWVDRTPNIGKGSGAFSSGVPGTHPYINMNYRDTIFSVSTLAHEIGHSMHSYLTWQNQPPIYARYSMFAAETASNFDQALVRSHLLGSSDDPAWQKAVIEEALSNLHRYLFVMPTLARFEFDCHSRLERGEALTAQTFSSKMLELFREGYGPDVEIDGDRVGITWAQFGHLYTPFYVFQYATGISAAAALTDAVVTEGQPAADRYLQFLKAGDSLFPLDALKLAGVDMTSPAPVERAYAMLGELVDRLDALVN